MGPMPRARPVARQARRRQHTPCATPPSEAAPTKSSRERCRLRPRARALALGPLTDRACGREGRRASGGPPGFARCRSLSRAFVRELRDVSVPVLPRSYLGARPDRTFPCFRELPGAKTPLKTRAFMRQTSANSALIEEVCTLSYRCGTGQKGSLFEEGAAPRVALVRGSAVTSTALDTRGRGDVLMRRRAYAAFDLALVAEAP